MRATSIKKIFGVTLLAGAALFSQACSSGKCNNVTCGQFEVCDSTDGTCKCGSRQGGDGGAGGVVCAAGDRCDGTLQQCVNDLCTGVSCSNGNTCMAVDGKATCVCGAIQCGPSQLCDQILHQCSTAQKCDNILCPGGESCDSTSGNCVCGTGAGCSGGQACVDGGCANDPCYGLHCSGAGMACYDGVCRCGSSTGPACNQDEICQGNACISSAKCTNVSCSPGNVCNAQDAQCHCATIQGPICSGLSTCVLYFPGSGLIPPNGASYPDSGIIGYCQGGNLCDAVNSAGGCPSKLETCDPNTGSCLCGPITDAGPLPPACSKGFFCASLDGGTPPTCFQPCDPYAQNCPTLAPPVDAGADAGAPDGSLIQACYYESAMAALVCEPILKAGYEGLACNANSDCPVDPQNGGLACFPLSGDELDAGFVQACRYYCDVFDGGSHICPGVSHGGSPLRQCVPVAIVDAGGTNIAVGACQPYVDGGGL